MLWCTLSWCRMSAPVYSPNDASQVTARGLCGGGVKCVKRMQGGREGRGAISRLVTDSSMQTTSPPGRNQEAGALTQAEGEGDGRAEQCLLRLYEESLGGRDFCWTDWTKKILKKSVEHLQR